MKNYFLVGLLLLLLPSVGLCEESKLDIISKYLIDITYGCKSIENLDAQIKNLKESFAVDGYFELNNNLKQINKDLENNKCIDKLQVDKQKALDYYDKRIAELEEELKLLDGNYVVYDNFKIGMTDKWREVLELIHDLQLDVEDKNNITGDLDFLIKILLEWKKELSQEALNKLRDELANEILEEYKNQPM
jgi:SMC interacting uncharacterized protein involved in chromosome segregation